MINLIPQALTEEEKELLTSIVAACGLEANRQSIDKVVEGSGLWAAAFRQNRDRSLHIVSFGLEPSQIGLQWQVEKYRWYQDGQLKYCFADRPSAIGSNVALKKQLWGCLKALKSS